ncbi:MAG: glycerate kinase [Nitrospirae bacterium]|nr:MAG: glycerate kinase [Nitrospirota bacterium]
MTVLLPDSPIKPVLLRCIETALEAVDPLRSIQRILQRRVSTLWVGRRKYELSRFHRVVVVGAGKASGRMAMAVEQVLGEWVTAGHVVVKDGYGCPTRRIRLDEAGHPLPDRRGMQAARAILKLVASLTPQDLLLVLTSGGASSLLPAPISGVSLAEKRQTTEMLLRSGATIQEINTVRKHLSLTKGGQLVRVTPARVISLIVSDVIGDDVGTIGSGPTAPDPTTFHDTRGVLQRYGLWTQVPRAVRLALQQGCAGKRPETPKPDDPVFSHVHNEIVGSNIQALTAVAHGVKSLGYRSLIVTSMVQGEAREVAKVLGAIARELCRYRHPIPRPACLVFGGEPTVTVTTKAKGGRAQELALSAAREIAGLPNLWIAAFGTDGTDGPTEVAGAVVDGGTVARAHACGLDLRQALARHESYHVFRTLGDHIVTGPTGTNVNDLYLILAP